MTLHSSCYIGRFGLLALTLSLLLPACSTTRVVDTWRTDQPVTNKPEKVAVIAVLPDVLKRKAYEIDMTNILADRGTPAVPGSNIPGMRGGFRGAIDTEAATRLLREADVDGVIVMFYAGGGNSEGYVRSDYWLQYLGSGMTYNWGRPYFTSGMTSVYAVRQGPGWADFRTNAYVESSYYDLDTERPIWRIVTFTKDIEHADTARDVARRMASEMRAVGL